MSTNSQYRDWVCASQESISQDCFSSDICDRDIPEQLAENNDETKVKESKLHHSRIVLKQDFPIQKVIVPAAGLFSKGTFYNSFKIGLFSLAIFCFNFFKKQLFFDNFWLSNLILQLSQIILNLIIIFFAVCLIIIFFKFLLDIFGKMTLTIDRQNCSITYSLFGINKQNTLIIPLKEIIRLDKYRTSSLHNSHLEIVTNEKSYPLFTNPHFLVTSLEIDWIAWKISNYLNVPIKEIVGLSESEIKDTICYIEQLSYDLERENN